MFELFENDGADEVLGLCPCPCVCPPAARQALKWSAKFIVRAAVPDPDNNKK